MTDQARQVIAGAVAATSLVLSLGVLLFGGYDPGFRLAPRDNLLVVAEVQPFSQAARDGVRVGMIAASLNGRQLIRFPEFVYPEEELSPPTGGEPTIVAEPTVIGPSRPTPIELPDEDLFALSQEPIENADLIHED